jgi:hypothetical protein
MVLKEVHDNMTGAIEEQFAVLSDDCNYQGPVIDAQWRPCLHKDHEYHHHSYQMCRWDYCPKLKR